MHYAAYGVILPLILHKGTWLSLFNKDCVELSNVLITLFVLLHLL